MQNHLLQGLLMNDQLLFKKKKEKTKQNPSTIIKYK